MNKSRRKEINLICKRLYDIQEKMQNNNICKDDLETELDDIYSDIEFVHGDEEYYMDNIPENMQGGYKYAAAEEACDNLENAMDSIGDAISCIADKEQCKKAIDDVIRYLYAAV